MTCTRRILNIIAFEINAMLTPLAVRECFKSCKVSADCGADRSYQRRQKMNIQFAKKITLRFLGLIALGAISVHAFAQSAEYRRGYDQGYRAGVEAQRRQSQEDQQRNQSFQAGSRVTVDEAYYGAGGATCDARNQVQQDADRQANASIKASNDLCGDPANGTAKVLRITYRCGDSRQIRVQTQEGTSVALTCR